MQKSNLESICLRNNLACYVDVLSIARKFWTKRKQLSPKNLPITSAYVLCFCHWFMVIKHRRSTVHCSLILQRRKPREESSKVVYLLLTLPLVCRGNIPPIERKLAKAPVFWCMVSELQRECNLCGKRSNRNPPGIWASPEKDNHRGRVLL